MDMNFESIKYHLSHPFKSKDGSELSGEQKKRSASCALFFTIVGGPLGVVAFYAITAWYKSKNIKPTSNDDTTRIHQVAAAILPLAQDSATNNLVDMATPPPPQDASPAQDSAIDNTEQVATAAIVPSQTTAPPAQDSAIDELARNFAANYKNNRPPDLDNFSPENRIIYLNSMYAHLQRKVNEKSLKTDTDAALLLAQKVIEILQSENQDGKLNNQITILERLISFKTTQMTSQASVDAYAKPVEYHPFYLFIPADDEVKQYHDELVDEERRFQQNMAQTPTDLTQSSFIDERVQELVYVLFEHRFAFSIGTHDTSWRFRRTVTDLLNSYLRDSSVTELNQILENVAKRFEKENPIAQRDAMRWRLELLKQFNAHKQDPTTKDKPFALNKDISLTTQTQITVLKTDLEKEGALFKQNFPLRHATLQKRLKIKEFNQLYDALGSALAQFLKAQREDLIKTKQLIRDQSLSPGEFEVESEVSFMKFEEMMADLSMLALPLNQAEKNVVELMKSVEKDYILQLAAKKLSTPESIYAQRDALRWRLSRMKDVNSAMEAKRPKGPEKRRVE